MSEASIHTTASSARRLGLITVHDGATCSRQLRIRDSARPDSLPSSNGERLLYRGCGGVKPDRHGIVNLGLGLRGEIDGGPRHRRRLWRTRRGETHRLPSRTDHLTGAQARDVGRRARDDLRDRHTPPRDMRSRVMILDQEACSRSRRESRARERSDWSRSPRHGPEALERIIDRSISYPFRSLGLRAGSSASRLTRGECV